MCHADASCTCVKPSEQEHSQQKGRQPLFLSADMFDTHKIAQQLHCQFCNSRSSAAADQQMQWCAATCACQFELPPVRMCECECGCVDAIDEGCDVSN